MRVKAVPAYEREPYLRELSTTVLYGGIEEGRPFALLDDTILYPEGGGQPADRGFLDETPVLDVQRREGEIRHYLAGPVPPGPVRVRLLWERRFDHMQQHTGQHLLTAVAQDRLGWETTAFHLGAAVSDIELSIARPSLEDLARLEEAVAAMIRASRPVTARRMAPDALAALPVRTRGLPEGHEGEIRLVEIAGVDLNTCGGTHLSSTAEIEVLKLLSTETIRGGTRLFFVAGGRARRRLARQEERGAALRSLLGAPDDGLVEAVRGKLDQLHLAERRARRADEELAAAVAERLSDREDAVLEAHFEDREPAFLQKVARVLSERSPRKTALLTATREGEAFFALVGSASFSDVAGLFREVAALLGGRGGGTGRIYQGKATTLAGRAAALDLLRRAIAAPSA